MIPLRLYLYAGAVAVIAAAFFWFSHARYAAGEASANAHWAAEIAKERATAQALLNAETLKVRKAEDDATSRLTDLSTNYERRIIDDKSATDTRIAALRSGTDRMRVAINPSTCSRGPASGIATTSSGSDGPATAELSSAVAANLEQFAADADAVVNQLTLAQETIRAYYKAAGPQ